MRFHVITLFPEMIKSATSFGVVGQAIEASKIFVATYDPRTWATDVHRTVDDRPFGGGDGMVMIPEALEPALDNVKENLRSPAARRIYLSARGKPFSDQLAREYANEAELVLLCGRYGGVDQRFIEKNNFEEVSIGEYVLSGGELGALVLIDAIGRLLPGVLGNSVSSQNESFAKGWLEHPQFSRPREWGSLVVPEILFSGNHAKINSWRESLAILATAQLRPDLLVRREPSEKQVNAALDLLVRLSENDRAACGLRDVSAIRVRLETLLKNIRT